MALETMSAPPPMSQVQQASLLSEGLFAVLGSYSFRNCKHLAQGGEPTHKWFSACHDILLLRKVNDVKPWEASYGKVMTGWDTIAKDLANTIGVGLKKDGPACKKRFELLLELFRKNDLDALRKSGVDEDYQEKEQLLSDIRAHIDDWQSMAETAKSEASSKKEALKASRAVMRQLALGEVGLTGLDDDDNEGDRENPMNRKTSNVR